MRRAAVKHDTRYTSDNPWVERRLRVVPKPAKPAARQYVPNDASDSPDFEEYMIRIAGKPWSDFA